MSSLVSPASTRYREPVTEWAAPRKVNFATEKDLLVSVQVPAGNAQPAVTVSDDDDGGPTRPCSPPNDSAGLLLDYRTIPPGMQSRLLRCGLKTRRGVHPTFIFHSSRFNVS